MTDIVLCTARNRRGEPCKNRPVRGANVCSTHGGLAPQVRAKAAERVLEMRVAGELARREIVPVTNPVLVVQDLAGEALAWLALCRDQLGELQRIDYTDARAVQDVRPAVALYERALDKAHRIAADMVRLGIEAKAASALERDAVEVISFARRAIEVAREKPDVAADVILLELVGGEVS